MPARQAAQTDTEFLCQLFGFQILGCDERLGQICCVGVTSFELFCGHGIPRLPRYAIAVYVPVFEKVNRGQFSAQKLNVYAGGRTDVESCPQCGARTKWREFLLSVDPLLTQETPREGR